MEPALVLPARVTRSATLSLAPIRANLVRRFVVSIGVPPMARQTRASPGRFARQSDPEVGAPPRRPPDGNWDRVSTAAPGRATSMRTVGLAVVARPLARVQGPSA